MAPRGSPHLLLSTHPSICKKKPYSMRTKVFVKQSAGTIAVKVFRIRLISLSPCQDHDKKTKERNHKRGQVPRYPFQAPDSPRCDSRRVATRSSFQAKFSSGLHNGQNNMFQVPFWPPRRPKPSDPNIS